MEIIESNTVTEPGFYRMPAFAYHAGPCSGPELSNSIARTLLDESPIHAWARHSKLGRARSPESEPEDEEYSAQASLGSAIHKLALGYGNEIAVIDPARHVGPRGGMPKGYTNDSIRSERDEAISDGRIPLLTKYHDRAVPVGAALSRSAERYLGMPVGDCLREVVMVWRDGPNGHWRKAMIDIIRPDLTAWADLKSTALSLHPEKLSRYIYGNGLHTQLAFYNYGLDTLDPDGVGRRRCALLFGEVSAPYAVSRPMELTTTGMQVATFEVSEACRTWDLCLDRDEWPAFGDEPYFAEPAPWIIKDMESSLLRDEAES